MQVLSIPCIPRVGSRLWQSDSSSHRTFVNKFPELKNKHAGNCIYVCFHTNTTCEQLKHSISLKAAFTRCCFKVCWLEFGLQNLPLKLEPFSCKWVGMPFCHIFHRFQNLLALCECNLRLHLFFNRNSDFERVVKVS